MIPSSPSLGATGLHLAAPHGSKLSLVSRGPPAGGVRAPTTVALPGRGPTKGFQARRSKRLRSIRSTLVACTWTDARRRRHRQNEIVPAYEAGRTRGKPLLVPPHHRNGAGRPEPCSLRRPPTAAVNRKPFRLCSPTRSSRVTVASTGLCRRATSWARPTWCSIASIRASCSLRTTAVSPLLATADEPGGVCRTEPSGIRMSSGAFSKTSGIP